MSSHYPHLMSPGKIAGLELRNRIVLAAMGSNFAAEDGHCTERLNAYYEARAKGGAGSSHRLGVDEGWMGAERTAEATAMPTNATIILGTDGTPFLTPLRGGREFQSRASGTACSAT